MKPFSLSWRSCGGYAGMFWNKECANIHFLTTVEAVRSLLKPVSVLGRSDSRFHCRGGPVEVCRGMFQYHTCVLLF